jgi:hypothetical protein
MLRARSARFSNHPLALWIAAAVLAIVTWPIASMVPRPGLDPSWLLGLHMAAHQGLDFGRDLIFTYGPLGFMRLVILAYVWTTRLAFLATAITQFLFCATLIWGLRRITGSLLAAALATLVLAPLFSEEPELVIVAMGGAVALVQAALPGRWAMVLATALGVFGGYNLVGKLNTGVIVVALGAIAVALRPSPRRAPALGWLLGLVAGFLVCWFAARQSLSAAPDYVRASLQVISGYSEAMLFESPGLAWQWWAAGLIAALGIFVILRAPGDRRRRAALLVLWAVLAFTSFKSGFVRHDGGHAAIYFTTALGGLILLPVEALGATSAALAILLALVTTVAASSIDPGQLVAPATRAGHLIDQGLLLANGTKTGTRIAQARASLMAQYGIDDATLAALRGGGVHVDPWEAGVVWAERLPWKPLPVFQVYTAYTSQLDQDNAAAVASPSGPARILRQAAPGLDGRNPEWESPAATRAMLCHFRAVRTTPAWEVLTRVSDRCGAPVHVATVRSAWGRTVTVPAAPTGSALYVEIHGVAVTGFEKLRSTLDRALGRSLHINGTRVYRLIPGTAANGLLLHVPAGADFKKPFSLDQQAHTLALIRGPGKQRADPLVFEFIAVPVR